MRKPFRIASYVLGALVLIASAGSALDRLGVFDHPAPIPQKSHMAPLVPQRTVIVPAPAVGHVAPSLPAGADGLVVAICQKEAFGAGTAMRVLPGTYVDCADGATPYFAPGD